MLRNNAMLADAHISSLGYLWFVQMVNIPAYDVRTLLHNRRTVSFVAKYSFIFKNAD